MRRIESKIIQLIIETIGFIIGIIEIIIPKQIMKSNNENNSRLDRKQILGNKSLET